MLILLLSHLCCLPRRRNLLKLHFLVVLDGAVKDEAIEIGATENEIAEVQIAKSEVSTKGEMVDGSMMDARDPVIIQAY